MCVGHQNSNAPLILKVRNIICYAQDNFAFKKVSAPSKNPSKCPIMCFAREIPAKKLISRTFRISINS